VLMADDVEINYWEKLIYQFDGARFGQGKDKPKIFIIQACNTFGTQTQTNPLPPLTTDLTDTLVSSCTLPGTYAWRDPYKGSFYIHCLAQVVMHEAWRTEAQKLFGEKLQNSMEKLKIDGMPHPDKQKPTCELISFKKEFYFNPGV